MPYYVYILASRSRTLYTGVTNNLVRRVSEHHEGLISGFTRQYRIHRLAHFYSWCIEPGQSRTIPAGDTRE